MNKKTLLQTYITRLLAGYGSDTNKSPSIFYFGGENNTEDFINEVSQVCPIEKILDNNRLLAGRYIQSVEIVNPEFLKSENKGEYIVLILSKYVDAMGKQLEEMGLRSGIDYFDLHTPLDPYFRLKKIEMVMHRFGQFIDAIPENYFDSIPITKKEHIGIVCLCEMARYNLPYYLTQAILLRSFGHKVTLIIDSLKSFESYCDLDGAEKIALEYVESVCPKILKKCPDLVIAYIDGEGKAELSKKDWEHIKHMVKYALRWFSAFTNTGQFEPHTNNTQLPEGILSNTLSYIKAFFQKNTFDAISIYTGIHRHRSMYTYMAKQKGIRVATYDSGSYEKMLYSTHDVAGHHNDIRNLVLSNYFSTQERETLQRLAQNNFEQRKSSTVHDSGYNYQLANYDESELLENTYDILIPLNVSWDSAALNRDDLFKDWLEWLNLTLQYILKHTNATVMVREHPAQNDQNIYNYVNLCEELPILKENTERIYFAASNAKINTYRYLDKCRLVLPYTSTTGIEAVILGKNVLLHTNVYYQSLGIAYKAKSKEDYFEKISYYLDHPDEKICTNVENALLAYYFQMCNGVPCQYCIYHGNWMKYTLDELRKMQGIPAIMKAIGEGIPTIYSRINEEILKK